MESPELEARLLQPIDEADELPTEIDDIEFARRRGYNPTYMPVGVSQIIQFSNGLYEGSIVVDRSESESGEVPAKLKVRGVDRTTGKVTETVSVLGSLLCYTFAGNLSGARGIFVGEPIFFRKQDGDMVKLPTPTHELRSTNGYQLRK